MIILRFLLDFILGYIAGAIAYRIVSRRNRIKIIDMDSFNEESINRPDSPAHVTDEFDLDKVDLS